MQLLNQLDERMLAAILMQPWSQWPHGGNNPTRHDELCLHLARLRCERNTEEITVRGECEALLADAVQLRADRKELEEEVVRWQRRATLEADVEEKSSARSEKIQRALVAELQEGQSELKAASVSLRGVAADWVIEDEPEKRLERAEAECRHAKDLEAEYDEAVNAAKQLAQRLHTKLASFKNEEVPDAVRSSAGQPSSGHGLQDLERLRQEVRLLTVQVEIAEQECGEEAKLLVQSKATELPRLRAAERERQQLVGRLGQARYDRDNLERSYTRIVNGLREHEVRMEHQAEELNTGLHTCRLEGEEMVATMKDNDRNIAEMRKERWETEAFIEHLSNQVARLEDERNSLKSSLGGSGSALMGIDHDVKASVLALDSRDPDVISKRELEVQKELLQDEADTEAIAQEIEEQEEALLKALCQSDYDLGAIGVGRFKLASLCFPDDACVPSAQSCRNEHRMRQVFGDLTNTVHEPRESKVFSHECAFGAHSPELLNSCMKKLHDIWAAATDGNRLYAWHALPKAPVFQGLAEDLDVNSDNEEDLCKSSRRHLVETKKGAPRSTIALTPGNSPDSSRSPRNSEDFCLEGATPTRLTSILQEKDRDDCCDLQDSSQWLEAVHLTTERPWPLAGAILSKMVAAERVLAVNWLLQACEAMNFSKAVAFSAVSLLDRYAETLLTMTTMQEMQAVSSPMLGNKPQRCTVLLLTVICIALKVDGLSEVRVPLRQLLAHLGQYRVPVDLVLKKEREVLESLHFQVSAPTVIDMLGLLTAMAQGTEDACGCSFCSSDPEVEQLAEELLQLALYEVDFLYQFSPPFLAASAAYLACLQADVRPCRAQQRKLLRSLRVGRRFEGATAPFKHRHHHCI
ncbi:unnamed protein product [Effrenium voratum]|uniref:Cyclin N-terminal domain-containing protein n=1 Tax=Effrenium voratum TaxID=2562239 RepID=A0AA36NIH9_9DINO|nr:unnamed protein product [Effrenium voratum]